MRSEKTAPHDRPRPLRRVVLKEELVVLTDHWRRAMELNQFLYWSQRHVDFDQFIAEEQGRDPELKLEPTYGWIYKSSKELIGELMLAVSDQTLRRDLTYLVEHGWLAERHNPHQKWDRELQYRPDIRAIQRDLQALGYALDGYPLLQDTSITACSPLENAFSTLEHGPSTVDNGSSTSESCVMENAFSTMENGSSMVENGSSTMENRCPADGESKLHGGAAIPESTAETTTKSTAETTTRPGSNASHVVAVLMEAGLTKRQAMDAADRHHLTPGEAAAWRDWTQRLDPAKTNPAAVLVAALRVQRLPPLTRAVPHVPAPGGSAAPRAAPPDARIVVVPRDDGPPERVALAELWHRVQAGIHVRLAPNDFETWMSPTTLLDVDDEVALIGVPNIFVRQEFEACYVDLLESALEAVLRRPVAAQVVIDAGR